MAINPVLYNAIITSAADKAQQGALEQINIYLTIGGAAVAIVVFILGFLGYAQVRDIRTTLASGIRADLETELRNSVEFRRNIRSEIEADLLTDISKDIGRLERLIDIGRLNALTQKVAESQAFSNEERNSIKRSLVNLKDDPTINDSTEFISALKLTVDSFYAAALWEDLNELDNLFSDAIGKRVDMAVPMLESYGMRSLGEYGISEDERVHLNGRLLFYIRRVLDLKYPEIAYQYLLAYEVWKNGKTPTTDRIVQACFDLTPGEKNAFLNAMRRGSDPTNLVTGRPPGPEQIAFSEKYKSVVDIYKTEIGDIEKSIANDSA